MSCFRLKPSGMPTRVLRKSNCLARRSTINSAAPLNGHRDLAENEIVFFETRQLHCRPHQTWPAVSPDRKLSIADSGVSFSPESTIQTAASDHHVS